MPMTFPVCIYRKQKRVLRSEITEPTPTLLLFAPSILLAATGCLKLNSLRFRPLLDSHHGSEFFVSPFIDYSSEDGLFRKYRVAVIDGEAFPCHMAISEKWAIWYYNSGMVGDEKKLSEEDDFLVNFDLGKKHGAALSELAKRVGSEYFVLDCAETKTGELLIFEGGHDMIVHDMDSPKIYPFKNKHILKLFHAFQMMLISHAKGVH